MREVDGKYMDVCDICGKEYQNGPGVYEGHRLELYGDAVCCDVCWRTNWDGWNPSCDQKISAICKEKGVPMPTRNSKGWLPRA